MPCRAAGFNHFVRMALAGPIPVPLSSGPNHARTAMHRLIAKMLAAACLLAALSPPVLAQQRAAPPHAWLVGTWTGGMFPASANLPAALCLAQPTVIITQDLVLHARLTELTLVQRLIETVHAVPGGTEFRFVAATEPASPGPFGAPAGASQSGFGCASPDRLLVVKRGENEIAFPNCANFQYPLHRCIAR
jgi:hypothetical protein